jgi:hypothetical protein
MNLEDIYKNPFSEYNANVMSSEKILDYWCSPFKFTKTAPFSESDIYKDRMPIVFMGGRGTGKTMFLKYFSYKVQCDEALLKLKEKDVKSILSCLKQRGGIGIYLRIDGPILRSFQGKDLDQEMWDSIFTHYFELIVSKLYMETILDLINRNELNEKDVENNFVKKVAELFNHKKDDLNTISDILSLIDDELKVVAKFRGKIAFQNVDFNPICGGFASQSLSFKIPEIAQKTINEFNGDFNFVLLIDEYENFLESQQRIINTLIKFVKPEITIRIGMRLRGFHTFDTISPNEFIKEGRDYSKHVFEYFLIKDKEYQEYLFNIAEKRLKLIPIFQKRNIINVKKILGERENLEKEAKELVKQRNNHFNLLKIAMNSDEIEKISKELSNPKNPLLEMLNILWVFRGKNPKNINKTMKDYLIKKNTEDVKKYKRDYIDKYKLSLMFLLASNYKKHKKYYSFNTFCFLSSGIVGNFIELCRRCFQYAYFEEREKLLDEGVISIELQDRATRDLASAELDMIPRIRTFGDPLYIFTKNLGNIFSDYHKDPFLRYPETNQFSIDISLIEEKKYKDAFKAAEEWSIIQKKPTLQQKSPGTQRTNLYTLNRVFSPLFDISYRTRGGHSEDYGNPDIMRLLTSDGAKPKLKLDKSLNARKKLEQMHDEKLHKLSEYDK